MTKCPVCDGEIRDDTRVIWDLRTGALIWPGGSTRFPPVQAQIFDVLWRARAMGDFMSREDLQTRAYQGTSGGPTFPNTINKYLSLMRRPLKGTPHIRIESQKGRHGGYRVVALRKEPKDESNAATISASAGS